MNRQKGFTLVEMLVVIAVIGILSATALTALGPARNKAKDARIISGLNQVRAIAETLYVSDYSVLGVGDIGDADANFGTLAVDIGANGGNLILTKDANSAGYAAYSKLASDSAKYFCVDSTGFAGQVSQAPVAGDNTCK